MFNRQSFADCVTGQLKERGFGPKKATELLDRFNGLADGFQKDGMGETQASVAAMKRLFSELEYEAAEKAKRAAKNISVIAEMKARVDQGAGVRTGTLSIFGKNSFENGAGEARAAVSMIESDPRFSGTSLVRVAEALRGKYYAMLGNEFAHFSRNMLGRSRASTADLRDLVYEIFGHDTGNKIAKAFAQSWQKVLKAQVQDFNANGGSMRELDGFNLPQKQNPALISMKGGEKGVDWKADHKEWLDWDKMRWDDGSPIAPEDYDAVLDHVYKTLVTDGAARLDTSKMRGAGKSLGNRLDNHRFLIYKDADAWAAMHQKYGDGTVFDVITAHIDRAAHNTALINKFGTTPDLMAKTLRNIVIQKASEHGGEAQARAEAIMKNTFKPMFETATHQNAMDPHSFGGTAVAGISDLLAAAQLASAIIPSIPGDLTQSIAMRLRNNMPGGAARHLAMYVKNMLPGAHGDFQNQLLRTGFVADSATRGTYAMQRFGMAQTYGPAVTRTVSDFVLRLSGLNRHTDVARGTPQLEMMGMFHDFRKTKFDELPFRAMMERYGIGGAEWDALRKNVAPSSPSKGVEFMTPLGILDTTLPNKDDLYLRFHNMINQESLYMVPGSTVEAQTFLRGSERPDTLRGAIIHSFSMYKNFPVTISQMYGRHLMALDSAAGRAGFAAALGTGMLFTGALSVQVREMTKGREPLPMDTAAFWGKSMLAGGALSIWGDFLFSGVNEFGQGPAEVAAGPVAGLLKDSADLVFGDPFAFLTAMEQGKQFHAKTPERLAQFLKRYTPGTNLWYARLVLERAIWDNLDELADPVNARRKQQRRIRDQKRNYGNDYFWAPGQ